jgi:ketosteroid isomerase-like protein
MRLFTTATLTLPFIAAGALLLNGAAQTPADDAAAIRGVITAAYIEGIHKNGSRDAIRAGFHPEFVMKVLRDDGVADVTIEQWIARLPAEGTPPGREVTHRIPDVSVSGQAAVARVEVMFDGRHVYTDYMSLYRFAEGWRIVAKIYNTEPR